MEQFDVYFFGDMLPGAEPGRVRSEVARLFNADEEKLDRLFSGKAVRIKQGVDAERAGRYRQTFRKAGALVEIVPAGSPKPDRRDPAPAQHESTGTAPGSGLSLASPGATIDETPPAPPAHFDTSHLEALPANSGSLADCQVDKPAKPVPDISHLRLVDD
jgi:hypothetical protein